MWSSKFVRLHSFSTVFVLAIILFPQLRISKCTWCHWIQVQIIKACSSQNPSETRSTCLRLQYSPPIVGLHSQFLLLIAPSSHCQVRHPPESRHVSNLPVCPRWWHRTLSHPCTKVGESMKPMPPLCYLANKNSTWAMSNQTKTAFQFCIFAGYNNIMAT